MSGARGSLTVYLGAAPGVGKTFAALEEVRRRRDRGTDAVVGLVETHDRPHTLARLEGLEVLPRQELDYRGTRQSELDLEGVLARHPEVVLIDELAHTNVPGSRHAKRADDVETLLRAGIDVITTVNVQHLESLNDDVAQITGVRQRETVPDGTVRRADHIQLVDMSPEALRRRLAHGNVYPAERIDASLSSYFRVGNLTALRELALLWVADRVDDALDDYRRAHRIETAWPARERIVVAVTGGPESESLVRRGSRIAQRAAGSELLAVHVVATDGLRPDAVRIGPDDGIGRLRQLTESLGGTFHTVVGDEVSRAVVDFATGVNASMLVVGVSRRHRLRRLFLESTAQRTARVSGSIDVHLVTHDEAPPAPRVRWRGPWSGAPLGGRRVATGFALAVVVPALLTVLLTGALSLPGAPDRLSSGVAAYLAATVLVALVGGRWPALLCAVAGFGQLNWFLTPPVGGFSIASGDDVLALALFVLVAVAVASVVDLASRRAATAAQAGAEAAVLSELSRSVLSGEDTAQAIASRLVTTFGLDSVALLESCEGRSDGDAATGSGAAGVWETVAAAGDSPARSPEDADAVVGIDEGQVLALRGRALPASDRRVLDAFAAQAAVVLEYRRLREREARARVLERIDHGRTALLRAVSEDLRTPLDGIREATKRLAALDPGAAGDSVHADLVATVASSCGDLTALADDLAELARREAGPGSPVAAPRDVRVVEVVTAAIGEVASGRVRWEVRPDDATVHTVPEVLRRVLAVVLGNALRRCPGASVRLLAEEVADLVEVRVVDQGPAPQDLGLGLGLAVARGLAESVGAALELEETPGGGLTVVLSLARV